MNGLKDMVLELIKKYPGAVFLVRDGEDYVAFDQDAQIVEGMTGIKASGDTCRVPFHSLDVCLHKLTTGGRRVAVVDKL